MYKRQVMYAFGLMFLDISQGIKEHYNGQMRICIMVLMIAFLLLALFAFPIYHQNVLLEKSTIIINEPNTFGIGRVLFSKYLIAFEITGVLLLVALIGGVALGLKDNLNALIHSNALAQIKENIEANLKSKSNSQDSAKKAKSTPKSTKIPKS